MFSSFKESYFRLFSLISKVNSDPCKKVGMSSVRKIKFTTCSENQFTCNDGQCIDMDNRYLILNYRDRI